MYLLIITGLALLAVLTLFQIVGALYYTLYRFSVFIFIGIILLASLLASNIRLRYRTYLMTAAVILHIVLWYGHFRQFQIENRTFNKELFQGIEKDEVLAFILYDARYKNMMTYNHFSNYHIIWNHGIAVNRMVDFPAPWCLNRNVSLDSLPAYDPYTFKHHYRGGYEHVPYLLIRGRIPGPDIGKIESFFELHRERDPYFLYKNRNHKPSVQ